MGAGASATTAEQLKEAPQDDVKAVLAALPSEDQAKVREALAALAPPTTKTNVAEGDAPFLKQAFQLIADEFKQMIEYGMSGEDVDPDKMDKDMEAALVKQKELMGKSFDNHDTGGNGLLEKDEATVFFKNLLAEQGGLMENMFAIGLKSSTDKVIEETRKSTDFPEEQKADLIAEMRKRMEDMVADAKKNITAALEDYKANKDERDAAAFKVVDTSGNGTLERAEFLEAFSFGSDKNSQVFEALQLPL